MACNIIKDEDLIFHIFEYDLILVGTSVMNALGNGFQKKIALAFPNVNAINKATPYGDYRKLGSVKVIVGNPTICLCYINKGRRRPDLNPDYLNYEALEKCLSLINDNFKDKKIATTLIGGSKFDGDGNREKILDIINKFDLDIDIYDYEQVDYKSKELDTWINVCHDYSVDFSERQKRIKDYFWNRYFGEISPKPNNYDELTIRDIKLLGKQKRSNN